MKRLATENLTIIDATADDLKKFYDDWSLTLEGIQRSDAETLIDWIEQYTPMINKTIYMVSGKLMNDTYGLTGDNRYPDDLNIMVVMLKDMENANKITMPRFGIGGRWFTDVVDNNARREQNK